MIFQTYVPGPPLARWVEYLWQLSDAPGHARERIVPNGTLELVINLNEDEIRIYDPDAAVPCRRYPGAVVSGAFSTFFEIDTREHASVMGAHFRPGGASRFSGGVPAHLLGDGHVALDELWGPSAREVRERACAAMSGKDRFRILEQALLARRLASGRQQRAVEAAVSALRRPDVGVRQVADRLGISHKHFIDLFRAHVGMTPKSFQRVLRFQRALTLARAGAEPDWPRVALAAGYFDQSHLIRDFSAFSGLTPREYLREWSAAVKEDHLPVASSG
jgi:AraC-like DNA-binding protein